MSYTKEIAELLDEGRNLGFHLKQEAEKALDSWAAVEVGWPIGIRGRMHRPFEQPRNVRLAVALQNTRSACLRDALMTLSRMSDPPKTSKLTLFRASKILDNPAAFRELARDGIDREFERAVSFLQKRVGAFDKAVAAKDWLESEQARLSERPYTLMKGRAELNRFRNSLLSHSQDPSNLGGLWIPRFRAMLLLSALASEATFRIFTGYRWSAMSYFRESTKAQLELKHSTSIDFIGPKDGPLARRIWEKRMKRTPA